MSRTSPDQDSGGHWRDPLERLASAKVTFLAWADEVDAEATARRPRVLLALGTSLLTVLTGLYLAGRLSGARNEGASTKRPRRLGNVVLSLLLAARAARWLVPIVISVVRLVAPKQTRT